MLCNYKINKQCARFKQKENGSLSLPAIFQFTFEQGDKEAIFVGFFTIWVTQTLGEADEISDFVLNVHEYCIFSCDHMLVKDGKTKTLNAINNFETTADE